jgi:hypothetical protein
VKLSGLEIFVFITLNFELNFLDSYDQFRLSSPSKGSFYYFWFLRTYLFHLGYKECPLMVSTIVPYYPFIICRAHSEISSFTPDIDNLDPLFLFLVSLAGGLTFLLIFSKEEILVLVFLVFWYSVTLISTLLFSSFYF